ncbi:CCAAT-binding protein subunit HAP3 [Ophiocordyceps camponoti-floridani]|uniref:CCAAT-binding protein subunit HAP3 n=1 Tax=Ophiocordyceps camponoti-floridani TaxID=2030778 RepID=A0A8H4Q6Q6_9HYPO|nr:CCAAT-binding protein subunit HAP3 [Ophiocordyceps camponoti-floridani]
MSDSPQSPPKDVDHGAQSPDEEGQMNDNRDPQSAGLTSYEFEGVKEQDRWLPIANVARIMKNALPDNAKIAKEAKDEASEKCQQEKRKTVNGEDILFAMTSLGFENYSEALKVYLSKYREQQNQSNRERGADAGYMGSMLPGEKGEPGAAGGDYAVTGAAGEASSSADGGADPNYMYGPHAAHNGAGAGDGY